MNQRRRRPSAPFSLNINRIDQFHFYFPKLIITREEKTEGLRCVRGLSEVPVEGAAST